MPPARLRAQTTAPGPYYATPSWDQTIACTTTANCLRFIVLSNMTGEAVLDRETGLVWTKSPLGNASDWFTAQVNCNNLVKGNRKGWRLPAIQELASLVDPNAKFSPFLPAGHPFTDLDILDYWSATTSASNTDHALYLSLKNGEVSRFDKDAFDNVTTWCVRGGQGVDPQ